MRLCWTRDASAWRAAVSLITLAAIQLNQQIIWALGIFLVLAALAILLLAKIGYYWFQAYMCDADVSFTSLVVISFLRLDIAEIVAAKIVARQANLPTHRGEGRITTAKLVTHTMAGGSITNVINSMILAQRADINLDFDRATAIDLTGRDLLHAIQTSITPKVIQCPSDIDHKDSLLSAIAKDGVELRVRAKITVRTSMERLVSGATDETIVARVGQMIISTIGAAASYKDILANPATISDRTQSLGIDQDSAYTIVSIDIAQIIVGRNVGESVRISQAEADMRIASARAAVRLADAQALTKQMHAQIAKRRAELVQAEALVPSAIANSLTNASPVKHIPIDNTYPRPWNEPNDSSDNDKRTAS